ncbi:MAG: integration host factor subunit beta [Bdellovibrionaceae bacterium]|nr:integration host factor subunit beta [Pseudobdellovibrionaceae bacterium]
MRKISKKLKTKSELIEELSHKNNLSLSVSTLCVETIKEEIMQALLNDQRVELRGFGSFRVKRYKAYKGRNPQNQEKIMVRAKKRPWFKSGVFMKDLNKK